jgi:hypothetical protein
VIETLGDVPRFARIACLGLQVATREVIADRVAENVIDAASIAMFWPATPIATTARSRDAVRRCASSTASVPFATIASAGLLKERWLARVHPHRAHEPRSCSPQWTRRTASARRARNDRRRRLRCVDKLHGFSSGSVASAPRGRPARSVVTSDVRTVQCERHQRCAAGAGRGAVRPARGISAA